MAQWLGQYMGLTHATKVADAEDSLRVAVTAFRAANSGSRRAKAKTVCRLAARVLALRLKAIKAQRVAATSATGPSAEADRLLEIEESVTAAGVDGILIEFAADDAKEL